MHAHETLRNALMPLKRERQRLRRVLDVNYSSMPRLGRRGRCMNDQWPKGENSTLLHQTLALGLSATQLVDGDCRQPTTAMRAVHDSNGTVCRGARVEMDANGEHPLKDIDGRLHVWHAGLFSPGPISRYIDTLARRNREILMPHNFPIGGWRFVEEQRANGEALVTQNCGGQAAHRGRRCEGSDLFIREQVSRTAAPIDRVRGDDSAEGLDRGRIEHGAGACPATFRNGIDEGFDFEHQRSEGGRCMLESMTGLASGSHVD